MSDYYILEDKKAVPTDMLTWVIWMNDGERTVAKTTTPNGEISTVFIGLDHQFGDGPPLIFETMVFGGTRDGDMVRCTTWEQAEDNHATAIEFTAT